MPYEWLVMIAFWFVGVWLLFKIPHFSNRSQLLVDLSQVSIIIPARNEEKRISPLLESLKDDIKNLKEVIVVDDNSTDKTADIARQYGAKVVTPGSLPKGWFGKPWAIHQGAKQATGDIFIFLDADTVIEPGGLSKLVKVFIETKTPLSIQPYHKILRPYENLSLLFNLIVMMSSNLFTPFGSKFKPSVFFGPCQLMTKEDYTLIGGHELVRSIVLEDIAIGNLFLKAGRPIRSMGGRNAIYFRMYPDGISDVVRGWSKNFASGAGSIHWSVSLLVSLWLIGLYMTLGRAIPLILDLNWWIYAILLLYGLQLVWMGRRIGNFSYFSIFLYPFQALFFLFVFARSTVMTLFFKKVKWKDRDLSVKDEKDL